MEKRPSRPFRGYEGCHGFGEFWPGRKPRGSRSSALCRPSGHVDALVGTENPVLRLQPGGFSVRRSRTLPVREPLAPTGEMVEHRPCCELEAEHGRSPKQASQRLAHTVSTHRGVGCLRTRDGGRHGNRMSNSGLCCFNWGPFCGRHLHSNLIPWILRFRQRLQAKGVDPDVLRSTLPAPELQSQDRCRGVGAG